MGLYLRPGRLDEALAALAERADGPDGRKWTVLAGATDVYPTRIGRPIDDDVLDISAIDGLRAIRRDGPDIRIPAGATWTDLLRTDLPGSFEGLKTAARAVGGVQIQNRGTLCGNVCNASPAADGVPNLLALDARVELSSMAGTREIPVGAFVTGNRRTLRRVDELVTALLVPVPAAGARSVFFKLGARAYLVISMAMVAVVVEPGRDGRVATARIAVGACSEVAVRLPAAEARLHGARPGAVMTAVPTVSAVTAADIAGSITADDLAPLRPIDDVRASAAYRRAAALVLVRRAVTEVLA